MAGAQLLEHRLVEREPRAAGRPVDSTSTASIMRSDTAKSPARRRVERRVELVGLDLGEVAELADVDAEHGTRRRVHEVDGAQHRAVAAERDDEVEPVGELVGSTPSSSRPAARTRRRARAPRRRARRTTRPRAARASCAAGRSRCGTRPTARVGAFDARRVVPATTRRAPRRVDGRPRRAARARGTRRCRRRRAAATPSTAIDAEARRRRARRRPRAAPRACTAGSRTMPPLPDAGPARLELRLHEQHELGVGRGAARAARARRSAAR